jgi:D-alanyl-D-alanine carboxypeptidase (penicillin-binding protein 5/6)
LTFSFQKIFLAAAGLVLVLSGRAGAQTAQAFVTIDATTSYVLDQAQPEKKLQIASLTKIATAMVVLDWASNGGGDLAQVATISDAAFVPGGQNDIGFQPGDALSLRDLLYAALVQSDNIAAYTLANHVGNALQSRSGGPVDGFVQQMNVLAKHLGMKRTRFLNPNGRDDKERPFSTAADVARLTRYAMNNAGFRFYVSQKERQITIGRGPQHLQYRLRNTNEMLGVNAIDGVKTGRTNRAGDCLVLSAARPSEIVKQGETTLVTPRRLIVVLLGSTDRFRDGAALLDRGWQLYDQWAAAGRPTEPKKLLAPPDINR